MDCSKEPLVQELEKLQRRLMDLRPGAAGTHEGHVDYSRVVVARVLPAQSPDTSTFLT